MNKQKLFAAVIILLLLSSNAFFVYSLLKAQEELSENKAAMEDSRSKEPILEFTFLFIEKVLKAEGEVDFDTRLDLENKVRNLEDAEIFGQWNRFVNADNEIEAQAEVKNLLGMLLEKGK